MQKRLLLCLIISLIFTIFWVLLGRQLGYTTLPKPVVVEETLNESSGNEPGVTPPQETVAAALQETEPAEPANLEPVVEQRYDILENDQIIITLDNKGGVVRDVILKDFFKTSERLENVDLLYSENHFPAQLIFADGGGDSEWMYTTEATREKISYQTKQNGQTVHKTFTIGEGFTLGCEVKYSGGTTADFHMVVAEGLETIGPDEDLTPSIMSMGSINPKMMFYTWSERGDHEKEAVGKQSRDKFVPLLDEDEIIEWAGVKDNYFANVFLPDKPLTNVFARVTDVYPGIEPVALPVVAIAVEESVNGSFYLGPMTKEHLEGADPRFANLMTYGWAGALSKWLFAGLNMAHSLTNNWGWAIVLLTLFIRFLMVPLTIPSVKSSFKMKKIQPQIDKLKQKYSGSDLENKQNLSKATFELYRKEGVNPFSSCFTALAQMPVFFAYFSLLRTSMILRQAEWAMIDDLSSSDPTFILPILMGVTMFMSTMAMPMPSADPAQAKMMKFMPVIFSLMFVFMPAGLILYMITSNVFTMIQTKVLKRRFEK